MHVHMLLHVFGSLQVQQMGFMLMLYWNPYCRVYIVTWWSGHGGIEIYLSGQLACFSAVTL